ncbi:MAG: site-specific integrase, partial [Gammaproteobacteria bacterium]
MASIQKRTDSDGNITYRAQVRLKGFPPQTATFTRLTDARKWAQDTESAIREGRYFKTTEARRHTLDDAIKRYRDQFPESTGKVTHLDWWSKRIGMCVMADINRPLLSQCRDELRTSKTKGRMQKVERVRSTS